jgi:hypothetical protein
MPDGMEERVQFALEVLRRPIVRAVSLGDDVLAPIDSGRLERVDGVLTSTGARMADINTLADEILGRLMSEASVATMVIVSE